MSAKTWEGAEEGFLSLLQAMRDLGAPTLPNNGMADSWSWSLDIQPFNMWATYTGSMGSMRYWYFTREQLVDKMVERWGRERVLNCLLEMETA